MKLLLQPIYKPHLDQLYQIKGAGRGRGMLHSGLQCPYRYGLTKQQVQKLIDEGQWLEFLIRWEELRSEYLATKGLLCIVCNRADNKYISILGKRICKRCQKKIDKLMRQSEKSK